MDGLTSGQTDGQNETNRMTDGQLDKQTRDQNETNRKTGGQTVHLRDILQRPSYPMGFEALNYNG